MNTINKDELFSHVSEFLKARGIELQEGSYSRTIQKGCQVLADTINLSQQAVGRARSEVEKTLEKVRQSIHQKTAPGKPPAAGGATAETGGTPPKNAAGARTSEQRSNKARRRPARNSRSKRQPRKGKGRSE